MATALSIGMFDGVHAGHLAIIDRAREAVGRGGRVEVITFEPGPAAVLSPHQAPPRLTTSDQRKVALENAGVDEVHVLVPTTAFLQQSPEQFLDQLLTDHHPDHIVEGRDFRFGSGRAGDIDLLRLTGARESFEVHVVDDVTARLVDGTLVPARSSAIRQLLEQGRVRDAACLLGRSWQLEGVVVRGHQRGRELGCPTANLDTDDMVMPAAGIYAGLAHLETGATYLAAISVGTNPTFNDGRTSCEAHLLDFDGDLSDYGWRLRIDLDHWVREQLIFDSAEDLAAAIARDLRRVQVLMSG